MGGEGVYHWLDQLKNILYAIIGYAIIHYNIIVLRLNESERHWVRVWLVSMVQLASTSVTIPKMQIFVIIL